MPRPRCFLCSVELDDETYLLCVDCDDALAHDEFEPRRPVTELPIRPSTHRGRPIHNVISPRDIL